MVNEVEERSDSARYELETVIGVAQRGLSRIERDGDAVGTVRYAGSRVTWDVENLGYSDVDVHRCIAGLTKGDFQHSERYVNCPNWHDVYRCKYTQPGRDRADELYVKFFLGDKCLVVWLGSLKLR